MMRFRVVLAAVAVAALVPTPSAQAASSKAKRCTAKGAKTVVKDRYTRVFTVEGPGTQGEDVHRRLYGCLYSTGRRVLLDVTFDDELYSAGDFSLVQVNGRYVAWVRYRFDASCKAGCPPDYVPTKYDVNFQDLRDRDEALGGTRTASAATDLVVTRKGAIAWIEEGNVRALVGSDLRELDGGPVGPESLTLTGYLASWDHQGETRSAPLR
jgi:hypothetical protein